VEIVQPNFGVRQGSLFDYSENEEFLKRGGLKVRAPRKSAVLIVRRERNVIIRDRKKQ